MNVRQNHLQQLLEGISVNFCMGLYDLCLEHVLCCQ